MKIPRIANAVGQIDDDLVAGAAERRGSRRLWMKWGPF